jgi:hypothetical protein
MDMLFTVTGEGVVSGLHFDTFDLGFLGKKQVQRASEIMFNDATQLWDVLLPGQATPHADACGFASYNVARLFEVEWLQSCASKQVNPLSAAGAKAASVTRGTYFM